VPASVSVASILLVGGGGGGGGGSYGGSLGGGGGGGGGGAVTNFKNYSYFPAGVVVTIKVGAGGAGGAGASALNGSGSAGANGGSTKINDAEVTGGAGGGAGSIDVGGAGGASGSSPNYAPRTGGGSFNGYGGGGASYSNYGRSAGLSSAGGTQEGVYFDDNTFAPQSSAYLGSGGSGGAAGTGTSQTGGTSSSAASTENYKGAGGGGGHGCPSSQSPCANRDGSAGRDGMVLISTLMQLVTGEKTPDQRGYDFRFVVGTPYSFKPWFNPEPIGTGTWSITPAPPAGFTFNTSTGVLSGTATAAANGVSYVYTYTDSLGSFSRTNQIFLMRANQSLTLSNQNLSYGGQYRIPVEQLKGVGALSIQTSNANLCGLSGSKNETITALAATGSCTISVSKAIDNSYFSYSSSFTINLSKATPSISLAANIASPRVTGTTIVLTATTTGVTTGSADFYIGDTLLTECGSNGRVSVVSSSATCNWTPTSASTDPFELSVKYVENSNFISAKSSALSYQIRPDISLSYSNSESTFNNSATITPEVSGGTGAITSWSWSVLKTSDQQAVPGISISSSGVITVSSSLAAGTYAMTVSAQDTVGVSRTATLTIKVNSATPTLRLAAPSKSAYTKGQVISLLATLPNDATGTVTFKYGTTTITACGTSGNVSISSGTASCSLNTSSLTPGDYELSASYSGGGSYNAATSFTYKVEINPKSEFSYQNQSTTYKIATSLTPSITAGTGTGISSAWSWSVVKSSDSQTVSGLTVTSSGLVEADDTVGAGTYSLDISAVDLAGDTTTARVQLVINKATPTLTLSARLVTNAIVQEATAGRQVAWTIESTHRSSGAVAVFIDGTQFACSGPPSIFSGNGQCWWSSSNAGTTISAYATFAGDSNLESATTNTISNFAINPALSLSYSDTSTYVGIPTALSPISSGGSGRKTYSMFQHFTGQQVPGITVDTATGVIDVAASTMAGTYRMVLTVTDEVYANYTDDNVAISVLEHSAPDISLSRSSETVETGVEIQGFELSNTSTPGFLYRISPSLPTGFSFDEGTGKVRGKSTSAVSSRTFTITALNMAGSDTATYTLAVTEPTLATITLSIGTTPAAKGTANTIVATLSHAGRVEFLIDGKRVPGCAPKRATTSITCNWKPARMGSVAISARLTPTNNAISAAVASTINVGVGRRTGTR
jgi:hypothetical protein